MASQLEPDTENLPAEDQAKCLPQVRRGLHNARKMRMR